ncbi:hypothetical protein V1L54_01095 [Streptomyces sp. TRM 70361]|uniref:hypothetical protein n=1 Tax=Streptomyces sp. TRM 70361 TaxID=3116553 RepID=UPI002E7C41B9|nr:hypothetical protein [Streptomyces sp. TRM 70361]MEE1938027.1 hypothetical protein [Streptomyces sp. TRM 70361]
MPTTAPWQRTGRRPRPARSRKTPKRPDGAHRGQDQDQAQAVRRGRHRHPALALPLATASSAAAETRLGPHYTGSFLECQTLDNKFAQQGQLTGFTCVQQGN